MRTHQGVDGVNGGLGGGGAGGSILAVCGSFAGIGLLPARHGAPDRNVT
jgi:hypothetical protein